MQSFDKEYWEAHWDGVESPATRQEIAVNPYLVRETSDLAVGTALDAGCGEGAEAAWLAGKGWQVTAVDISAEALARATRRAALEGVDPQQVRWVEADLSVWQPAARFDLVTTFYAHASISQLALYQRLAEWVAPGGTLLIVGHDHDHGHGHHSVGHGGGGSHPPEEATVTASSVLAQLDVRVWDAATAEECTRTLANGSGGITELRDVVVRATRRL